MADLEDISLDDMEKDKDINAGDIGRRVKPARTEFVKNSESSLYTFTQQIAMPSSLGMKSPQKFSISSTKNDNFLFLFSKVPHTSATEISEDYYGGIAEEDGKFFFSASTKMFDDEDIKLSENADLRSALFDETTPGTYKQRKIEVDEIIVDENLDIRVKFSGSKMAGVISAIGMQFQYVKEDGTIGNTVIRNSANTNNINLAVNYIERALSGEGKCKFGDNMKFSSPAYQNMMAGLTTFYRRQHQAENALLYDPTSAIPLETLTKEFKNGVTIASVPVKTKNADGSERQQYINFYEEREGEKVTTYAYFNINYNVAGNTRTRNQAGQYYEVKNIEISPDGSIHFSLKTGTRVFGINIAASESGKLQEFIAAPERKASFEQYREAQAKKHQNETIAQANSFDEMSSLTRNTPKNPPESPADLEEKKRLQEEVERQKRELEEQAAEIERQKSEIERQRTAALIAAQKAAEQEQRQRELQEQLDQGKKAFERVQAEQKRAEEYAKKLEEDKKSLEEEKEKLKSLSEEQKIEFEERVKAQQALIDAANEEAKRLKAETERLEKENKSLDEERKKAESDLAAAQSEKDKAELALAAAKTERDKERAELNRRIEEQSGIISQKNEDIKGYQKTVSDLQKELEEKGALTEEQQRQLNEANENLRKAQAERAAAETALTSLKERYNALESKTNAEISDLSRKLDEQNGLISQKDKEIDAKNKEIEDLKRQLEAASNDEEKARLQGELNKANQALEQMNIARQTAVDAARDLQNQIDELETARRKEIAKLNQELNAKNNLIADKDQEIDAYTQEIANLNKRLAESEGLTNAMRKSLQDQLVADTAALAKAREEKDAAIQEADKLKAQIETLQAEQRERIDNLSTTINDKNSQIERLSSERRAMQEELAKATTEYANAEQRRIDAEARLNTALTELNNKTKELANAQKALDKINSTYEKDRQKLVGTPDKPDKPGEIKIAEDHVDAANAALDAANNEIERLTAAEKEYKRRLEEINAGKKESESDEEYTNRINALRTGDPTAVEEIKRKGIDELKTIIDDPENQRLIEDQKGVIAACERNLATAKEELAAKRKALEDLDAGKVKAEADLEAAKASKEAAEKERDEAIAERDKAFTERDNTYAEYVAQRDKFKDIEPEFAAAEAERKKAFDERDNILKENLARVNADLEAAKKAKAEAEAELEKLESGDVITRQDEVARATKQRDAIQQELTKLVEQSSKEMSADKRVKLERKIEAKRNELEESEKALSEANKNFGNIEEKLKEQKDKLANAEKDIERLNAEKATLLQERKEILEQEIARQDKIIADSQATAQSAAAAATESRRIAMMQGGEDGKGGLIAQYENEIKTANAGLESAAIGSPEYVAYQNRLTAAQKAKADAEATRDNANANAEAQEKIRESAERQQTTATAERERLNRELLSVNTEIEKQKLEAEKDNIENEDKKEVEPPLPLKEEKDKEKGGLLRDWKTYFFVGAILVGLSILLPFLQPIAIALFAAGTLVTTKPWEWPDRIRERREEQMEYEKAKRELERERVAEKEKVNEYTSSMQRERDENAAEILEIDDRIRQLREDREKFIGKVPVSEEEYNKAVEAIKTEDAKILAKQKEIDAAKEAKESKQKEWAKNSQAALDAESEYNKFKTGLENGEIPKTKENRQELKRLEKAKEDAEKAFKKTDAELAELGTAVGNKETELSKMQMARNGYVATVSQYTLQESSAQGQKAHEVVKIIDDQIKNLEDKRGKLVEMNENLARQQKVMGKQVVFNPTVQAEEAKKKSEGLEPVDFDDLDSKHKTAVREGDAVKYTENETKMLDYATRLRFATPEKAEEIIKEMNKTFSSFTPEEQEKFAAFKERLEKPPEAATPTASGRRASTSRGRTDDRSRGSGSGVAPTA